MHLERPHGVAGFLPRFKPCNTPLGRSGGVLFFSGFCGSLFLFPSEDESPAIVEDGEGHEREQEDHAQHLGAFHEFLARFAPRDNFVEEEEHVAAIEGGDGEDVDEGEHEGDEGR